MDSDRDAQLLILENFAHTVSMHETIFTRNINKYTMEEFQSLLSWEQWDDVFGVNDNIMFNDFLNTYLRCYYSSFAKKKQVSKSN
jgi:hypothetical protein